MTIAGRGRGAMTGRRGARETAPSAAECLAEGRVHERDGRMPEAFTAYRAAIREAERSADHLVLAETLRRVSVLHHQLDEPEEARRQCRRSYDTAIQFGDLGLAAEALNTLGAMEVDRGRMPEARRLLEEALALTGGRPDLRSRVEQNLGIMATIHGDHDAALGHYISSLEACRAGHDDKGCAIAYHNLGMISADRGAWAESDGYYESSRQIAERIGDVHLQGLCLLNHSEVHLAREQFEQARENAEAALTIFDRLGSQMDKADAYRVIGVIYRETGRPALGEARLRAAIDISVQTGSVLSEAEASRELARLYQGMGRNQDALTLLNGAYRLFRRLDAHLDLVDVEAKVADLEGTFLAVVRDWGQSIETADSYTFGHCGRVAEYAEAVAGALGCSDMERTTIRLGAYLHDVGKVKVPHEVLNKPGRLTTEEFEIIKQHPAWGVELLAAIDFPWDLKPIIRWHHEKYDGTGYPDRLAGDAIPVSAQIIGIVDVYDALTTTRSYRPAMTHAVALETMQGMAGSWRPDVFSAFLQTVGAGPVAARATA